MIKSITFINDLQRELTLELSQPELTGYAVTDITGATGNKAEINVSEIASTDGGTFNSARVAEREMSFTIAIIDNKRVVELRRALYALLPIKRPIEIIFDYTETSVTDSGIEKLKITGYVENLEPILMGKRQTVTITFICPYPYMTTLEPVITEMFGTTPSFEFEFSNESLDEPLISFGEIQSRDIRSIYYPGTVAIGFDILIHASGTVENLTIVNTHTLESMILDTDKLIVMTGHPIIAGDIINISTVQGYKSITLTRNGVETNILNILDRYTDWFELVHGDNLFTYYADTGDENIRFTISNNVAYLGI